MRTAKEVKQTVSLDLKQRRLNRTEAGTLVGLKPQTLTNLLCRDAYFNEKQAWRFHQAFGYDEKFLLSGEGELIQNEGVTQPALGETINEHFYIDVVDDFLSVLEDAVSHMLEIRNLEQSKALWKRISIYLNSIKIARKLVIIDSRGEMMRLDDSSMLKLIDEAKAEVLGMIEV